MTRSRLARSARPIAVGLMLGALAACGGAPNRVVTHGTPSAEWPRPDVATPPGSSQDPWGPWIQQASALRRCPTRGPRGDAPESGGVPARLPLGAMGLMQVMPAPSELQARHGWGNDLSPVGQLMAGTAYIRQMYELYGSPGFLAAYNAGPRRLEDYLWGNRGLPDETRNYVARIGPRIHGTSPNRRAAPEVYAAAELPFDIPRGPRRGDTATMLALRDQRRAVEPGIQVAQLPPGQVVRMDPIPDGSTGAPAAGRTQIASAGDFERRMDPVVSPGDPGMIRTETLAPPSGVRTAPAQGTAVAAAPAAPRSFALIPSAQAGTLQTPRLATPAAAPAAAPARVAPAPIATGGGWGVQVGAFASENLARAAASQARDQMGAPAARMVVEPVNQGSTTLFRARVVGLQSRGSAEQACERLGARGGCMILAPGA